MPSLDWIGKKAVVNHYKQVLFQLLPYYAGQVKCISIDLPYNTGVDERDESGKRIGWVYDDNVSSPEIKEEARVAV